MTKPSPRRLFISPLVAGALTLPLAIAAAMAQPSDPVPEPLAAAVPAATLAEVDRVLHEALQARQEADRKAALKRAQEALDRLPAIGSVAAQAGDGRWAVPGQQEVERFEADTRQHLRETLMHSIWRSPYGGFEQPELTDFEPVSDALRLLRELIRVGGGDMASLRALQDTYWDWLLAHRAATGIAVTALDGDPAAPVFEQRLMRDGQGRVQLYQLTGDAERTLRWVASVERPVADLGEGGLTIRLEQEKAPALLVLDGAGLSGYLVDHAHWLAAVQGRARLVLRYREDYLTGLRALDPAQLAQAAWPPYVLPEMGAATPPSVRVIDVAGQRELGRWPLSHLDGPDAPALKAFLYHLITALDER